MRAFSHGIQRKDNDRIMAFFAKREPISLLIVGLGNPLPKYQNTRHNAGFEAIDAIAKEAGVSVDRVKFKGLTARISLGSADALLLKPTTYMNLSGEAVAEAARFYKIPPERILVFCDDISLDCGKLRIRRKGSAGGHNGLKNIIEQLGSSDFVRVKLGVGQKPHPDYDLAAWVLSTFSSQDQKKMEEAYSKSLDIAKAFAQGTLDRAMNRFNS